MRKHVHDRLRARHALVMTEQFRSDFVEWVRECRSHELNYVEFDLEHCLKAHKNGKELYFFSQHYEQGAGDWVELVVEFAEDMRLRKCTYVYDKFCLKSAYYTSERRVKALVQGELEDDPFGVTLSCNVYYTLPED